jgi:hypothetical protein
MTVQMNIPENLPIRPHRQQTGHGPAVSINTELASGHLLSTWNPFFDIER